MIIACKKEAVIPVINNASADRIEVDVDKISKTKASDLFSHVEFIPLETSDENLMGNIEKITVYEDKYFILDEFRRSVLIYSADGIFLDRIFRVGLGPFEYDKISGLSIDFNNKWLILSSYPKTIYFDIDTYKPIKEEKEKSWSYYLGYKTYLTSSKEFELVVEEKGEVKYTCFPNRKELDYFYYVTAEYFSQQGNDSVYFIRVMDDNIYKITKDSICVAVVLDFGDKKLPNTFFKDIPDDEDKVSRLLHSHYCFGVSDFIKSPSICFFDFIYNGQFVLYLNLYEQKVNALFDLESFEDDLTFLKSPFPILYVCDTHILSYFTMEHFMLLNSLLQKDANDKWKKEHPLFMENYFEIIKKLSEKPADDNPILVKWYFKH